MSQRKKGFTLIEVSLVFGLAAAIFLMAFIALPSLWISQRDAQRKANVMELVSDIKIYQTNNSRGALPTGHSIFRLSNARDYEDAATNWRAFVRDYVSKDFADPDMTENGSTLQFQVIDCTKKADGATTINVGGKCRITDNNNDPNIVVSPPFNKNLITIYIFTAATCDGDHAVRANSERSAAVVQVLEHGGRYCHNT